MRTKDRAEGSRQRPVASRPRYLPAQSSRTDDTGHANVNALSARSLPAHRLSVKPYSLA